MTGRFAASLALAATLGGCARGDDGETTLRFWAMGREGEVVRELVRDFELENPGVRVDVQQIPWSAAHEKLLTAHVGRSTPDVAQLGNTWIAEFVALGALAPLGPRVRTSAALDSSRFFPGIWDTNVLDGEVWGIPWYVDTRLLFYRSDLLKKAGVDSMPKTWDEWRTAMVAVKRAGGSDHYGVFFPINEWAQPITFGLQMGSPLLADRETRGAFSEPAFRRAFEWYVGIFRDGLSPPVTNNEIANVYQEFGRGTFAMFITGPWNLGEFRDRLPAELQDSWSTAPLPGPEAGVPGVSLAGGSSLVLFRGSKRGDLAWTLVEYLARPDVQTRFWKLCGDLPANVEAWADSGLANDPRIAAFHSQLEHVVPTPKIPEWEQIASRVQEHAELALRGAASPEEALARMDADANRILEKRRWLLEREGAKADAP